MCARTPWLLGWGRVVDPFPQNVRSREIAPCGAGQGSSPVRELRPKLEEEVGDAEAAAEDAFDLGPRTSVGTAHG